MLHIFRQNQLAFKSQGIDKTLLISLCRSYVPSILKVWIGNGSTRRGKSWHNSAVMPGNYKKTHYGKVPVTVNNKAFLPITLVVERTGASRTAVDRWAKAQRTTTGFPLEIYFDEMHQRRLIAEASINALMTDFIEFLPVPGRPPIAEKRHLESAFENIAKRQPARGEIDR